MQCVDAVAQKVLVKTIKISQDHFEFINETENKIDCVLDTVS